MDRSRSGAIPSIFRPETSRRFHGRLGKPTQPAGRDLEVTHDEIEIIALAPGKACREQLPTEVISDAFENRIRMASVPSGTTHGNMRVSIHATTAKRLFQIAGVHAFREYNRAKDLKGLEKSDEVGDDAHVGAALRFEQIVEVIRQGCSPPVEEEIPDRLIIAIPRIEMEEVNDSSWDSLRPPYWS